MTIAGERSTVIPSVSLADEILVNRENSTARQPFGKFALQVLSSSAIGSLSDAKQLYPARADLPAASGLALRFSAVVFADPNGNNNGTWSVQLNNLGDKTWLWSLPLQFSVIRAVDTGAGTANAIQASSNVPVADGILTAFRPFRDSGAGAATVSFNGDDPLTIRDAGGSIVVAASGVKEGVTIAGFRSGAYFDLITDIDAAASAASAAASAALAGTTASTFLSTLNTALTLAVEEATESAGTSATDAATARDLAQKWASHPENSVVAGGLYSAFHWAQKAAAAVLAGLVDGSVTAAKLASNVVSGLATKTTLVDADTFLGGDSGDLGKPIKFTVGHVVSAIFNGTRVIANGVFLAPSFAWQNAGGFKRTHNVAGHTANRDTNWPDGPVNIPAGDLVALTILGTTALPGSGTANTITGINSAGKNILYLDIRAVINAAGILLLRLGTSAGVVSTAYNSAAALASSGATSTYPTTGFALNGEARVDIAVSVVLRRIGSTNKWSVTGTGKSTNAAGASPGTNYIFGDITLADEITQIQIATVAGTATITSGSVEAKAS